MRVLPRLAAIVLLVPLCVSCAGTEGQPETVRRLLSERYIGKELGYVVADLGAPDSTFEFDDGRMAHTWRRETRKYWANKVIMSDERCVITMVTDTAGKRIETISQVDDSLGAWEFSYCREQLGI